jgi:oxygen-independent coproporphyrinogen-3 oxidase
MTTGPTHPGFAVYVHWPFCLAKCPYCDFNSHVRESIDQAAWSDALVCELDRAPELAGLTPGPVTSVFFGGGTPSLMAPATVARVLQAIDDKFSLAADAEVTLEANPTSVEARNFEGYVSAGVNRFSLGVQALDDQALEFLGRHHSVAEALKAVELARRHCDNVSFDLIYARPGQTPDDWGRELRRALDFGLSHVSLYQLTIERGTQFFESARRGDLIVPDDDTGAKLFEITQEICRDAGLPAYEISNHARPGLESRHNLTYWRSGSYLGLGPGAHGRINQEKARLATQRVRSPEKWLAAVVANGHGTESSEQILGDDLVGEILMMGLRLQEGINIAQFQQVAGKNIDETIDRKSLDDLISGGFVEKNDNVFRATARGRMVLNEVVRRLIA